MSKPVLHDHRWLAEVTAENDRLRARVGQMEAREERSDEMLRLLNADNERLRKALAVYAERDNWFRFEAVGYPDEHWEWFDEATEDTPWLPAQKGLAGGAEKETT